MGGSWSTMKSVVRSSKEGASDTTSSISCSSNKAPSTSTTTFVIEEDQVCSTYQVRDGNTNTPTMPGLHAEKENSLYEPEVLSEKENSLHEPVPSGKEIQESLSYITEFFEPLAHSHPKLGSCSTKNTIDATTSDAKPLEISLPRQSDIVQSDSTVREAILICCSPDMTSRTMEMIIGAAKDKDVWDAFRNSESVVQFKKNLSNKIPVYSQALTITESDQSEANIQTDGNRSSEVEQHRNFKLILDKAKEMVLEVVIKAFAGMERVFISHEQPGKKTNKSCCDLKHHPGEKSTTESVFVTIEHILRTPFLATLLINATVLLCRIVREMLKYRQSVI